MDNKLLNTPVKYSTKINISPSSIHKLNPEFSLCDIDVMYIDENRNGTNISRDVVENAIYSLYGVPIVGEWLDDEGRFGDHGEKIEISKNKIICTVTTKPIGFVTQEAIDTATWIEKPLPNGHEIKTWLHLKKCILWTGRYEEAQSIIDNGTFQSMEVKFQEGTYLENGIFKPSKMIFSALCAIGVEPCFEEANIRRAEYEMDSFKAELKAMLDEYKKFNNEPNSNNSKGEQKMELAKFAEILSTVKIGESENLKYSLLNNTDTKVYALDMEDYKPYGFDYAITKDNGVDTIVVDFDSKVEMSLSATEKITEEGFSEFNIQAAINSIVEHDLNEKVNLCSKELETEFNKKFEELKEHYEILNTKYAETCEKLATYQAQEAEEKAEKHRNEINGLFEKYSERLGKCSDFLVYKARIDVDKVSVDEVQEKLTLMVGKYTMDSQTKKNFSYQPHETKVTNKSNDIKNRYGNLLDKFMN